MASLNTSEGYFIGDAYFLTEMCGNASWNADSAKGYVVCAEACGIALRTVIVYFTLYSVLVQYSVVYSRMEGGAVCEWRLAVCRKVEQHCTDLRCDWGIWITSKACSVCCTCTSCVCFWHKILSFQSTSKRRPLRSINAATIFHSLIGGSTCEIKYITEIWKFLLHWMRLSIKSIKMLQSIWVFMIRQFKPLRTFHPNHV